MKLVSVMAVFLEHFTVYNCSVSWEGPAEFSREHFLREITEVNTEIANTAAGLNTCKSRWGDRTYFRSGLHDLEGQLCLNPCELPSFY